ncbi:MAG TPA: YlxR family protein [Jatrophihabitans sp.]|nr:YlxR family protein [Jatrophihabitans sp.]
MRTCVGCRRRAPATDLLRVVAGPEVPSGPSGSPVREVLPDPRARATGRGAWVHPDPSCVALAERRRAFGRALRSTARLDPAPVRRHVEAPVRRDAGPEAFGDSGSSV